MQGEQATKEFKTELASFIHNHIHYRDPRLPNEILAENAKISLDDAQHTYQIPQVDDEPILLTKAREGDACPSCESGKLKLKQAVEIGHTFHLGRRYSVPLEAHVLDANNRQVPIEMGCHGIGVSRLMGAIAALLADSKGLNWPLAISPFDVVIVPASKTDLSDVDAVYDGLAGGNDCQTQLDVVIDDREKPIGWRLNDADLIGYPFIVVMGNAWKDRHVVELQCRRLGMNTEIPLDELAPQIQSHGQKF